MSGLPPRSPGCAAGVGARWLVLVEARSALVLDPRRGRALPDPGSGTALAAAVDAALASHGGREPHVVVGAVPFDHGRVACDAAGPGARLLLGPAHRTRRELALPAGGPGPAWRRVGGVPADQHTRRVDTVLGALAAGAVRKVVLARRADLVADGPADLGGLVHRLAARDPTAMVFRIPLADGGTFFGASPELLVARAGPVVTAHPLAGSAPRSADPVEDRERARRLDRSGKDRREHAYVVDHLVEELRPWCADVRVEPPRVVATPRVWHLGTRVRGRLRDTTTGAARLALALHPTPAVGGTPTAEAVALARALEGAGRGYYAGAVGWQDERGDGRWYVAVRSAHLAPDERHLSLHAGGGIVTGSEPATEVAETDAKFRTVLDTLEVRA